MIGIESVKLREMYDESMKTTGQPPLLFALFDRRVLIPRSELPDHTEESEQEWTLGMLDEIEQDGLFKWHGGAGEDGTELGVPLYIPSRIGLFLKLEALRWSRQELKECAEWEEWIINECVLDDELKYEDSDVLTVARRVRKDIEMLEMERTWRMPVEQRPPDWRRTSWGSQLEALSVDEIETKLARKRAYLERLLATNLESETPEWKLHVGRNAFCMRWWEETIRVMTVMGDRLRWEAGFGIGVILLGESKLAPDVSKPEEFGTVDWRMTLDDWRFLDDPDHYQIRMPGMVLVGGRIVLNGAMSAEQYAERRELFMLEEYENRFKAVAGQRRCANCSSVLRPNANQRRRYCSSECSQAARQKSYRVRRKQAILRTHLGGAADSTNAGPED